MLPVEFTLVQITSNLNVTLKFITVTIKVPCAIPLIEERPRGEAGHRSVSNKAVNHEWSYSTKLLHALMALTTFLTLLA
jgi:hypothetical protein